MCTKVLTALTSFLVPVGETAGHSAKAFSPPSIMWTSHPSGTVSSIMFPRLPKVGITKGLSPLPVNVCRGDLHHFCTWPSWECLSNVTFLFLRIGPRHGGAPASPKQTVTTSQGKDWQTFSVKAEEVNLLDIVEGVVSGC